MDKFIAERDGYAINSKVKEIINKEGYVALRIIDKEKIKICEACPVNAGSVLPLGADTVVSGNQVREYERIILIENNF